MDGDLNTLEDTLIKAHVVGMGGGLGFYTVGH